MGELDIQTALDWRGRTVIDRDGERIGTLKEIYLDESERPSWGSVHTALFGLRETLVPLSEATPDGEDLRLHYARDHVNDAPSTDPGGQLEPDDEERLFRHYEIGGQAEPAADAMTRSEEELHIGTRRRERGRARLEKYVVTEYVEMKVPVRREKARVVYEPAEGEQE